VGLLDARLVDISMECEVLQSSDGEQPSDETKARVFLFCFLILPVS
jgi:hypothetical protein